MGFFCARRADGREIGGKARAGECGAPGVDGRTRPAHRNPDGRHGGASSDGASATLAGWAKRRPSWPREGTASAGQPSQRPESFRHTRVFIVVSLVGRTSSVIRASEAATRSDVTYGDAIPPRGRVRRRRCGPSPPSRRSRRRLRFAVASHRATPRLSRGDSLATRRHPPGRGCRLPQAPRRPRGRPPAGPLGGVKPVGADVRESPPSTTWPASSSATSPRASTSSPAISPARCSTTDAASSIPPTSDRRT